MPVVLLACAALAAPAGAAAPFTIGFTDDVYFDAPAVQAQWVGLTVATGARTVLLEVDWSGIAPGVRPAGFDPTNPADPSYKWTSLDYAVRGLAAQGVTPAFLIVYAPAWAEGPGMPAGATPGTWEPDAASYGQFARAIALRYSGSFPDPLKPGAVLPRVRYFEAWGEPNLTVHLAPQWTRTPSGYTPASPVIYRALLNAFYAGVKSVRPDDLVITGGTGPFGDPIGGQRMPPAQFVRELLCLGGQALRPEPCPNPAHFDILAHDPYEVGAPTAPAFNVDDVSAPDLGKLTRVVNRAVRLGLALPHARKRLWVTEFSYDSNPPNPQGVPEVTEARWAEQSFYVFWSQGADTLIWYLVRDQAPIPSYAVAYESGVYLRGGAPKPHILRAFQFPFVAAPAPGGGLTAWGKSPVGGVVLIERQRGRGWTVLARMRVAAGAVFERRLSGAGRGSYRAVVGRQVSLVWQQT